MQKIVQIAVLFALLACAVHSQKMIQGMTMWNPRCPHNDASCFMSVWGTIMADKMWLGQAYHMSPSAPASQPAANCSYYNFVFESFFWGETVDHQLMWMNSTDSNNWMMNATMTGNDLMMMNGTACMWMPQTEWTGIEQYICKMSYDTIHVYLSVWGSWMNGTWMWDTTHGTTAWWPKAMWNTNDMTMQANWVGSNAAWPSMVASIWDSCGSNMNVTSLSSNVTINIAVNLTAWLPNVWLSYVIVKPWSSKNKNGSYMVWPAKSNMTLFDTWSSTGCWWMGMMWSDILPNMDWCKDGCEVSFVMMDQMNRMQVMETSGLWTMASMTGGSGANSTGTGSGTGSVTVGAGNGGATVTVSSALSMGINMLSLVLAFVYMQ